MITKKSVYYCDDKDFNTFTEAKSYKCTKILKFVEEKLWEEADINLEVIQLQYILNTFEKEIEEYFELKSMFESECTEV